MSSFLFFGECNLDTSLDHNDKIVRQFAVATVAPSPW